MASRAPLRRAPRRGPTVDKMRINHLELTLPKGALAFYVKYLLPVWIDVRCMEWKPGTGPARRWTYS
jgi:hypothetical protein